MTTFNKALIAGLLLLAPQTLRAQNAPQDLPGMNPPAGEPSPAPPAPARAFLDGPWYVADFEFEGLRNVARSVAKSEVGIKKHKVYTRAQVNADVEALQSLGLFERTRVDISPADEAAPEAYLDQVSSTAAVKITFLLQERPTIKERIVKGQKKLSRGRILDELGIEKNDALDEIKLAEGLDKVREAYRKKGYISATVDASYTIDPEKNTAVLTVEVVEGPRARVTAVRLEGASAFPAKKLKKKLHNRRKKTFDRKKLAEDYDLLERFYKNRGFVDYKVEDSSVTVSEDGSSVEIYAKIHEGRQARFGKTSFSGNTVVSTEVLDGCLTYRPGKVFNQERFDFSIACVQEEFANKGYLKALIQPQTTFNEETDRTDIEVQVTEGQLIYVEHVDVEGLRGTKPYVIRREITQKEKAPFSAAKIRRSQEKLMNLGFLDDVRIEVNPTPDPDKIDVLFDITEGKPGMLTAGAGISSLDGVVGTLSLSHLNLFGRGWRTQLQWQFGSRVQDYSLSWTTRWLKDKPISLGFDAFNTRRRRPFRDSRSAYTDRRKGGTVRLGPRWGDDRYFANFAYTFQEISLADLDGRFLTELSEGTSVTSSLSSEFAMDTRDNVWDPTRGGRQSVGYQLIGGVLGGDIDVYKVTLSNSWNFKLFDINDYPFVLSFSNRAGYTDRFGQTGEVPVFDRHFLGGPDTLRGYDINGQVGPLNGGKIFDVFNAEFKFPLAREHRRSIVNWAFFVDIGNTWENFRSLDLRIGSPERQMKVGAGFGIRFVTPAFPIRLDWGYGFNHGPGESLSEIYFTLGNLF